jgi:Uma2 family endonuclease
VIEPQPDPISLEEYDCLTPPEGEHYELIDGYLYAFATGTGTHGVLCTRIANALGNHVKPPCTVFGASTIGVRQHESTTNVIPDGAVTCDDTDLSKTYIVAPKLVVEVISPRSVRRDRADKLDVYRAIPSVLEYLMVDSRRVWASVFRRGPGGSWLDFTYSSLDESIGLLSVDLRLPLRDLYRGLDPRMPRRRRR